MNFFGLYHSKSPFFTTIWENIFGTFSKHQRSNMHNSPRWHANQDVMEIERKMLCFHCTNGNDGLKLPSGVFSSLKLIAMVRYGSPKHDTVAFLLGCIGIIINYEIYKDPITNPTQHFITLQFCRYIFFMTHLGTTSQIWSLQMNPPKNSQSGLCKQKQTI